LKTDGIDNYEPSLDGLPAGFLDQCF